MVESIEQASILHSLEINHQLLESKIAPKQNVSMIQRYNSKYGALNTFDDDAILLENVTQAVRVVFLDKVKFHWPQLNTKSF